MVHRGVGAERGIKDPVVVEVPLKLDALRRGVERGGQRDVDEVATLALLILHHGSQRHRRGILATWHGKAQDHQTQKRCSTQFEPSVVFHIGFSPFVCVLNRVVESIHCDRFLLLTKLVGASDASRRKRFRSCYL